MQIDFLATLFGEGPLHPVLIGFALAAMVVAVGIWVMEFSGRTISRAGIVPNNVPWNATSIALVAVAAAIYIAGRPIQLQFIPGIGGFDPTMSLAPIFAALLRLAGSIFGTVSWPIAAARFGALSSGLVPGFP